MVLVALAAVFATGFVPPKLLMLAAFVLFAYMLLVMAPVWLGWIEDDIDEPDDFNPTESVRLRSIERNRWGLPVIEEEQV